MLHVPHRPDSTPPSKRDPRRLEPTGARVAAAAVNAGATRPQCLGGRPSSAGALLGSRRSSLKDASPRDRGWDFHWRQEGSPFLQNWRADWPPSAPPAAARGAAAAAAGPSASPTNCTSASSRLRDLEWEAVGEPRALEFSSLRPSREELEERSARLLLPQASPSGSASTSGRAARSSPSGGRQTAVKAALQHFRREAAAIVRTFLDVDAGSLQALSTGSSGRAGSGQHDPLTSVTRAASGSSDKTAPLIPVLAPEEPISSSRPSANLGAVDERWAGNGWSHTETRLRASDEFGLSEQEPISSCPPSANLSAKGERLAGNGWSPTETGERWAGNGWLPAETRRRASDEFGLSEEEPISSCRPSAKLSAVGERWAGNGWSPTATRLRASDEFGLSEQAGAAMFDDNPLTDEFRFCKPADTAMLEGTPPTDGRKPRSPRVDDTMDDVTRHLMHARDKIEAVELEFAQIMGELASYGERWADAPGVLKAQEEPRPGSTEYFCINTPTPHKPGFFSFAPNASPSM